MKEKIDRIEKLIEYFNPERSLKNEKKGELLKELRSIKNEGIENEEMEYLIDKLGKPVNNKVKENIIKKTRKIITDERKKMTKQYEKKIVDTINKSEIKKDRIEKKDFPVHGINELEILEKELDSEIGQYNKYTEQNPMRGVSYNKEKKKYILRYKEVILQSKTVKLLAEKMQELLGNTNKEKIFKIVPIEKIAYKEKNIVLYQSINDALFDIQHIMRLLNIIGNYADEKYRGYKDKITHYGFKENEYGGYILKEFIPENVMYELVLSSNSEFSKSFKKDVSEILTNLRRNGQLTIKDDKLITIKDGKPNYNKKNICDENIKKFWNETMNNNTYIQTYENPIYCSLIKELVEKGSKIVIQRYAGKHVLYMFLITLQDPLGYNRIFCKIGYTADIITRYKTLQEEYKCNLYLLGLKTIKNEKMEKEFHKNIKTTKDYLNLIITLNNKEKQEIYVFDEQLYKEFMAIEEYEKESESEEEIEGFIIQSLKDQYQYFLKYLNNVNSTNFYNCMIKIPNLTETHKKTITTYITFSYNQYVSDLSFTDKNKQREHEIEMKEKDLEMKRMDLEMEKMKLERAKIEKKNNGM